MGGGSGSGEDRLLGISLMVSGIVIFRVKIDFSVQSTFCNGNRLQSLAPLSSSPASVLPIIVWEVMFSIKLPSGSQKSQELGTEYPMVSQSLQTYEAYSSSVSISILVLR